MSTSGDITKMLEGGRCRFRQGSLRVKLLFQLHKRLAKWRPSLVKNCIRKVTFLSKNSNFFTFRTIRFGSNLPSMWSKYVSNTVCRNFRFPMSVFETVARKIFSGKFTAKIYFPVGHFMLPLMTLTLEI